MGLAINSLDRAAAATSILLSLLAFGIALYLLKLAQEPDRLKSFFWAAGICLVGLAGLMGSIIHGFRPPGGVLLNALNISCDLCQIFSAGMFLSGVVFDLFGPGAARQGLPYILSASFVGYLAAYWLSMPSATSVVYETAAMLVVFTFYSWLATRFQFRGARWVSLGAVFFIAAALLQAGPTARFNFFWPVDVYAVANVFRMLGLLALACGLRSALLPDRRVKLNDISPAARSGL